MQDVPGASAANAAGEGYLTILAGRSQWAVVTNCKPIAGTVSLDQVASTLAQSGIHLTGSATTDYLDDTSPYCTGGARYATWAQLASLRDQYGYVAVSEGVHFENVTKLSGQTLMDETCGSIPIFQSHGFDQAWGWFSAPGGSTNKTVQQTVSTCFAYGRKYSTAYNERLQMGPPWWAYAQDIQGVACNDSTLPCYTINAPRYESPDTIAAAFQAQPDEWRVVQFYRFVTGARPSGGATTWDCTGTSWTTHWTSKHEVYCWNDFLAAVAQIPPGVTVTDPATVANSWGRGQP